MKLTDTYDLAGIHDLAMTLQLILAGKSIPYCMPKALTCFQWDNNSPEYSRDNQRDSC